MSGSTPRRPSSSQASSSLPEGALRPRSELKHAMEDEIANQTFIFPSRQLARILSPKAPKPGVEAAGQLLLLHQYDCLVDQNPFNNALDDVVARLGTYTPQPPGAGETACYSDLTNFLTECVGVCHDALDKQDRFPSRRERWYSDLEFSVGKTMVDGVDGAAALKPDITGGKVISALREQRLYWNPPPGKHTHRITLPVEVKRQWRSMVSQAATYARCLFSSSPMRRFALILAFNQESNMFRFLAFHRGGLTASDEYNITERDGLKEIARLFLTLALWTTAEEAGLITCCNDTTYLLPGNQEGTGYVSATVKGAIFRSLCVRGRMTSISRLSLPTITSPVVPESLEKVSKPLVELGGPLRRSARIRDQQPIPSGSIQSEPIQHTGGIRGRSSRSPTHAIISREKGQPAAEEQLPELARSGSIATTRGIARKIVALSTVSEQTDDGQAQTDPDVQVKYIHPKEIIRSEDDPILSKLTGTVIVKTSWPGLDRRSNEADMYRDSAGRFGTIPHESDIQQHFWKIFARVPPKKPETRTLRFTVFGVKGKSLVEARNPRQLSRALAHFLLGWLSTYLSGHLHRDISIGNILMTDEPVKRKKFEEAAEEIAELCKQVEEIVAQLDISDQCIAFVTDGDLAISWKDYWTKERRAAKSGTPEFMSRALLGAIEDHLHSPVDDLESCFWVSVWSVLFNKDNAGDQSVEESVIKDNLIKNHKTDAIEGFSMLQRRRKHSNITQRFRPVLLEWWKKVRDQHMVWNDEVLEGAQENADGEYYLPHFHRFALQGVLDVSQVLAEHWDGEVDWESWAAPVPSA
ncbi:hypothetical protein BDM02DRAFT_3190520 [Thelephora ganbajun]|uniref:Uncharacterized protein n=1 Tax=Thelephora ganbajun TaxID=370292 RepID=A0ACB6Z5H0_THEGA|nr:hypothetical protein BDM02DRAFT_3190520 [Thelephora ganbajun]